MRGIYTYYLISCGFPSAPPMCILIDDFNQQHQTHQEIFMPLATLAFSLALASIWSPLFKILTATKKMIWDPGTTPGFPQLI